MPAIIRTARPRRPSPPAAAREAPPEVLLQLDAKPHDEPVPDSLADDLLEGATEIAEFIFGPGTHAGRAHTALAGKCNPLPHFQIGGRLYTRKSVIVRWIGDQEMRKSKMR